MGFEFYDKELKILEESMNLNEDVIKKVARKMADVIEDDKIIHTFGSGHSHMAGLELFARAGGLGNVDAMLDSNATLSEGTIRSSALEKQSGLADIIYDRYNISKGDMMIITSNSGRNAMPIEMAMRCKKEGIFVVAITNLEQSKSATSRHPSGKKLYEFADIIIDSHIPSGDAIMEVGPYKIGPASSITTFMILDTIYTEATKMVVADGKKPYVLQSQNVDGFNNDDIYKHFMGRVKHYY